MVIFLLFAVLSGVVSLFLVETMSTIRGNEAFQAHVEFSTIAHLYLGRKAHICMQVVMYCALQSVNVASIIISNQVCIDIHSYPIELTRRLTDYGHFTHSTISQNLRAQLYPRVGLWYVYIVCL